jgi:chemotaxis signal transduction protein
VFDGRTLVGEPVAYDINAQIIIAGDRDATFGLLVDQVRDVDQLDPSHTTPLRRNTAATFLQGVVNSEHGSVLLFDFVRLREIVSEIDVEAYQTDNQAPYRLAEASTRHQEPDYEQTTTR